MKTISIFTEKGGEGKTTLSMLLASWLAYSAGEFVSVLDFDHPTYQLLQTRNIDERMLSAAMPALSRAASGNAFYPVQKVTGYDSGYDAAALEGLVRSVREIRSEDGGYLVMDFPGRFLKNDAVYHILRAGLLDLLVIPVSSDRQSILSARQLIDAVHKPGFFAPECRKRRQEVLVVWNKVSRTEFRAKNDRYAADEEFIRSLGVKVSPTRVRDIVIARRDSNAFGFIRSTVCWPAANVRKAAPYLPELFAEIKTLADSVK